MSNYEWESGTIKLPTAEFARVRKAVETVMRERQERVFAATQEFWKSLTRKQQTNPAEYAKAVEVWGEAHFRRHARTSGNVYDGSRVDYDHQWNVQDLLRAARKPDGAPRRVIRTDLDQVTNRTNSFRQREASLSFDRTASTVVWVVGENNHAVDTAHETEMGKAFFGALATVKWTRGTGGWFEYNSEYNEDEFGHQRGPTQSAHFGPLGQQREVDHYRSIGFSKKDAERIVKRPKAPARSAWAW